MPTIRQFAWVKSAGPLAFNQSVASGSMIIAFAGSEGTADPLTMSDTLSTVYSKGTYQSGSNKLAVYYGTTTAAGANTVTFGGLNTSYAAVQIYEVTGLVGTLDSVTSAYLSANPATCTLTTTGANPSMIFYAVRGYHTGTISSTTPNLLTLYADTAPDCNTSGFLSIAAPGTYTLSLTNSGAADNMPMVAIAFQATAVGGGGGGSWGFVC